MKAGAPGPRGASLERVLVRLVEDGARVLGIGLPHGAPERLGRYGVLLVEAGGRAGFRAPGDPRMLAGKHLLDSLTCLLLGELGESVLDVGSGVGLPGLVLASVRPSVRVVLAEPRARRAGFLRWAVWQLGLDNVEVRRARAEELREEGAAFDRVVARALAPLARAAELCLPLVGAGGEFVAMLGPRGEEELRAAADGLGRAGSVVKKVVRVELPWGAGRRVLAALGREERTGLRGN